jgi:hypothetical protein
LVLKTFEAFQRSTTTKAARVGNTMRHPFDSILPVRFMKHARIGAAEMTEERGTMLASSGLRPKSKSVTDA